MRQLCNPELRGNKTKQKGQVERSDGKRTAEIGSCSTRMKRAPTPSWHRAVQWRHPRRRGPRKAATLHVANFARSRRRRRLPPPTPLGPPPFPFGVLLEAEGSGDPSFFPSFSSRSRLLGLELLDVYISFVVSLLYKGFCAYFLIPVHVYIRA